MLGIKSIHITTEILLQVSEIDEFKGLWKGLDRHTTGLQLLGDVASYGAEFEAVLGPLKDQPITADIIRALHASQIGEKGLSSFKQVSSQLDIHSQNQLVGMLATADPQDVEPLLLKLCDWINEVISYEEMHPLIAAAVFVSVFLQISPFEAANMRVARFLLILIMLKAGYTYAPYASLVSIMDERGAEFYEALSANQRSLESGRADWSAWLSCFLTILQDQKNVLHQRLYGKETELSNLPDLSARIMGLFKEHKRLQMKQIIKLTRGRRATIKLRLAELLDAGYLRRHGQGRGTWYSLV